MEAISCSGHHGRSQFNGFQSGLDRPTSSELDSVPGSRSAQTISGRQIRPTRTFTAPRTCTARTSRITMNNGKQDEKALLGVFEKTSYITIGAEGKPLDYGSKAELLRSCYKGKQFGTVAPREGKTVDVYFERKHNWIAEGDKYVDKWRYIEMQKEKKKGFGTSDFSKRDEFSNTVRTLQWREQLEHEAKWTKQAMAFFQQAAEATGGYEAQSSLREQAEDEPALYDLVYEATPDRHAPASSRLHRDTRNRTKLSHERNLGGQLTTQRLAFGMPGSAENLEKPEFARKPFIRDTFYRGQNIFFPPNCDSTTAQ